MLVSDNSTFFALPQVADRGRLPIQNPKVHLWTDDYSSLLPLLR